MNKLKEGFDKLTYNQLFWFMYIMMMFSAFWLALIK